jgi:hypothetical protein
MRTALRSSNAVNHALKLGLPSSYSGGSACKGHLHPRKYRAAVRPGVVDGREM